MQANRDRLVAAIRARESFLASDRDSEHRARLDSFRARNRGREATLEGSRLRAQSERLRESNIHELNRLRADLADLEIKIRGQSW